MKILLLGSTGMLGHVVKRYFEKKDYEVFATTRDIASSLYFDAIKDINSIEKVIENIKPDVVINCIGILNKACDENIANAILVNSYLPNYLDNLSIKYNYKFIHISTDCVFDGKEGGYSEDSIKNATTIYGQTKALGEINNDRNLTLRTSIIGPDESKKAIGLFSWFMKQEGKVNGYSKVYWSGVTTIELAERIEEAINNNLTGLYHVVSNEKIDKCSLLELFKKYFYPSIEVIPTDEVKEDKSLITTKDYKFNVPSYDEMILKMKSWVKDNEDLYPSLIEKMKGEGIYEKSNDNCGDKTRNN